MTARRYLFVCSRNRLRSPTAEQVFADLEDIETLSAGTNRDADVPLNDEIVAWADVVFVMERSHREKLRRDHRAALRDTRIVMLGIPDEYDFMDPDLVRLLKAKMARSLPLERV